MARLVERRTGDSGIVGSIPAKVSKITKQVYSVTHDGKKKSMTGIFASVVLLLSV